MKQLTTFGGPAHAADFCAVKPILQYRHYWLYLLAAGLTVVLCGPRLFSVLNDSGPFRRGMEATPLAGLVMCGVSFLGFVALGYANALLPKLERLTIGRVLLRLVINVLAVVALAILSTHFQAWLQDERLYYRPRRNAYLLRYVMGAMVTVAVLYARMYFIRSREMAVENARIKELHARAELAALQTQLDPHFLFNSLNTISATIKGEDAGAGVGLIDRLAEVYRYVLRVRERALVPLGEELSFVEHYRELLGARFGTNFTLDIAVDPETLSKRVPPLALQLLVENAVKHNAISRRQPLVVKIYAAAGQLVVENGINPKWEPTAGAGKGLLNLQGRYELLGQAAPIINRTPERFQVSLPLLPPA